MDNYQLRVIEEKTELDKKLESLNAFLASDSFNNVKPYQQEKLKQQRFIMQEYSEILKSRISDFNKE